MTHRARKRFGQNFLHDPGVIQRIVQAVAPRPQDHIVEIGPGQAAITRPLLASGCRLTAIEIDRDLAALLRSKMADEARFRLIEQDVLTVDLDALQVVDRQCRARPLVVGAQVWKQQRVLPRARRR